MVTRCERDQHSKLFLGKLDHMKFFKKLILKKTSKFINNVIYIIDQIIHKIWPKKNP